MDIETIWEKACPEPVGPWGDLWKLAQAGVPADQLYELGADDITIKNGKWERRFRGDRAIIVPTFTAAGEMTDLVAFRLDTPRSFWLLTGNGMMLGHESLDRADYYRQPLMVHESPMEWLRAGRTGIVILDWQRYWPAYLGGVSDLLASSVEFGRTLSARLNAPLPIPQILVAT